MIERIPHSLINNVLSNTNIIDLIDKRIKLKKQGKNFYTYCPFHQETHPSFSVSPEKQFYYCFSCGAHGNAIDFLIQYEHLGFVDSLKELASIKGIDLTFKKNEKFNNKKNHEKKKIYELMNHLSTFYQENLIQKSGVQARQYLEKRGLNQNIIKYFNIGFAPNNWETITKKFGMSENNRKLLKKTGMTIINNQNSTYDRFRERIIFPIHDKNGQVIAFGGRALGKKLPKYLNSPDTDIFQKRNQLYGLHELQKTHKKPPPYILLVEGYMDVISLTQFGINYVVASLGTSTTKTHIQLLYHNTDRIICCYDGDHSGQTAAWRTLQITLPYLTDTRTLSFTFLPKKEDPDTLIRKIGKEEFLKYIKCAEPLSKFLFKILLQKINIKTIEGRSKFGHLVLPIIDKIPGKILQIQLRQELGKKIGILDNNTLKNLLKKSVDKTKKHQPISSIKNTTINIIISLLIQQPNLHKLISIKNTELKTLKENNIPILIELIKLYKNKPNTTPGQILEFYRNDKNYKEIKKFTIWNHMIPNNMIKKTFIDAMNQVHRLILSERQEELIAAARNTTLTKHGQKELWVINKKLAKKNKY